MQRRSFAGFDVVVESPQGSMRQWRDRASGQQGETRMLWDYGYLDGHMGVDGDEVDCYLGPDENAGFVYVVHQLAAPEYTAHDEDKCFLGFASEADARAAYLGHRSDGDRAYGGMTAIPLDRFRAKLARRTGAGKIRHAQDGAGTVLMRIEHRGSKWVVLPESGDDVLGTHDSKEDALRQLRAIEAAKSREHARLPGVNDSAYTAAQTMPLGAQTKKGDTIRFDALGADGLVRTYVWDRICVPGRNVKDGEETVFDANTCTQMVRNFARRGDPIMIDWNHQSSFAHENGQPAPALGFYGALAAIFGGRVVACEFARGVDGSAPAGLEDGLWGLRTEVTKMGQELLPGFKLLSPTFTPDGTDQQGNPIGYQLLAVAATNTPWQAGTQLTMEIGSAQTMSVSVGADVYTDRGVIGKIVRREGDAVFVEWPGRPAKQYDLYDFYDGGLGKVYLKDNVSMSGGKTMNPKQLAAAKIVGLDATSNAKAVRAAYVARFEGEAAKAMEEDAYNYEEAAKRMEEEAQAYEDAAFEEEEGGESPHVVMRKMAAKFRKLAKLEDPPFGGKESPEEEAAEDRARGMEADGKDDEKAMEAAKPQLQAMARRLGVTVRSGASAKQLFEAISAAAVPASQIGTMVQDQVKRAMMERDKETARADAKRRAQSLVDAAVAGGYPEANRQSLLSFATTDYEGAVAMCRTFIGEGEPSAQLFSRMTEGGAPIGGEPRNPLAAGGKDRRVHRNELATWVIEGEQFSRMAQQWADAKDGAVKLEIDGMLSDHEREHPALRLYAANTLLKKKRPDLYAAAEENF